MAELNYDRIARILGGTMTEIHQPVFGALSLLDTAAERFRSVHDTQRRIHLTKSDIKAIFRAFEETRDGFEVDRVLVDDALGRMFLTRCQELGVAATESVINKKIQSIRKSGAYGLKLTPTKRGHGLHEAERFTYVAEFAFSQLTYSPDLTEDDVITNPVVGDEFSQIAKSIDPYASPMMVKWALISLRKARGGIDPVHAQKILALRPKVIENRFEMGGTLAHLEIDKIPAEEGVFAFRESTAKHRYLYLADAENLQQASLPFKNGRAFAALSNPFWRSDPNRIVLRYATVPKKHRSPSARDWRWRLVQEWKPLFNIPVNLEPANAA